MDRGRGDDVTIKFPVLCENEPKKTAPRRARSGRIVLYCRYFYSPSLNICANSFKTCCTVSTCINGTNTEADSESF